MSDAATLAWVGHMTPLVLAGFAFGVLADRLQLCTMGAVADAVIFNGWRRARLWAAMIAGVALSGGAADAMLPLAFDLTTGLVILAGGAFFGAGMVMAGGCVSSAWLRAAAGSARSLLVVAVAMVFAWPTAHVATQLVPAAPASTVALPGLIGVTFGVSLLVWVLADVRLRRWRGPVPAMAVLGATVALTALPTVEPMNDGLRFLPRGSADGLPFGTSNVVLLVAVAAGAAASAFVAGRFRLVSAVAGAGAPRVYGGAVLMGFGGGLAGGCTMAIGTLGVGLLSPLAILALTGMVAGAVVVLWAMLAGGPSALWRGQTRGGSA